jgi:hypothetical protein
MLINKPPELASFARLTETIGNFQHCTRLTQGSVIYLGSQIPCRDGDVTRRGRERSFYIVKLL